MTRVVMPRRPTSLGSPHLVPVALVVERVAADDDLLDVLEDGLPDFRSVFDAGADPGAGDALVGLHGDHIQPGVRIRVQAVGNGRAPGPSVHYHLDVRNFQDGFLLGGPGGPIRLSNLQGDDSGE